MPDGAEKPTDYQAVQLLSAKAANYADMVRGNEAAWNLMSEYRYYTMTSIERMFDLCKGVEYIVRAGVPGSFVECGVWRGGSMMLAAATLKMLGDTSRTLLLYDTFEGHPKPDAEVDTTIFGEVSANEWHEGWAKVDVDEVAANMELTGYPRERTMFIKGKVEDTLPAIEHESWQAALVRLDTDWYASTAAELRHLWPKLSAGGVMIIDDYGVHNGAAKAVDEYFADKPVKMTRVDHSCRVIQK